MTKLRLMVGLVASAALAPIAQAQTVSDPDPYYGIPESAEVGASRVRAAPPAAEVSPPRIRTSHWGASGPAGPQPAPMTHSAPMTHATPAHAAPGHPPQGRRMHREVRQMRYPAPHHRGGSFQFHRIGRGGMVPHFWFGPQFVVRNWGGYGFPQPFAGGRWIRYYDDALLIDRDGRVHDSRYGWDWDRAGDRWGSDQNGVPVYVGDGEFEPERWDYEWAERCDRDGCGDDGELYAEGYGPPPPPHPQGAYGQGYGPAYGYGYGACTCGPVVVTETTVTTPAVVEQVTYYEYVHERVRPATRHKVYRSPRVKARRVPVHPGEKG